MTQMTMTVYLAVAGNGDRRTDDNPNPAREYRAVYEVNPDTVQIVGLIDGDSQDVLPKLTEYEGMRLQSYVERYHPE